MGTDIKINGNRSWDIAVHDDRFYSYVLRKESLDLGESYMFGWWTCTDLEEFLHRIIRMDAGRKLYRSPRTWWYYMKARMTNRQTKVRSRTVAAAHYDIGNDLYREMLGKTMMYSCGYWREAPDLEEAQLAKMDLICSKLKLRKGDRVLDIGCGWGGFARYAAMNYGVEIVGVTIAQEQAMYAEESCKGLPVEIRTMNYRDLNEKFDKIVSIGMFEHVGYKNYGTFMKVVKRCMRNDSLFLLHTIGSQVDMVATDPWIDRYIFPGGMVPSVSQLVRAFGKDFVLEDWHNFGMDYNRTLRAWKANFEKNWSCLRHRYDSTFYRMWIFYLSVSAASFRARTNCLWQVVLTKKGNTLVYIPER